MSLLFLSIFSLFITLSNDPFPYMKLEIIPKSLMCSRISVEMRFPLPLPFTVPWRAEERSETISQSKNNQSVKRPSAMLKPWVRFWGREDPLEKEMAAHSSTRARKIPWTEERGRLQSMGSQRVGLSDFTFTLSWWDFCFTLSLNERRNHWKK